MGYAENMYEWLKRKGYAPKYDHAGIYCIKINDTIVYIGKSHNMLKRVAQHYAAIQGNADKFDAGNNRVKYSRFVPNMV